MPPKNERIAPNHFNLPNMSIRYAQYFHTVLIEFMAIYLQSVSLSLLSKSIIRLTFVQIYVDILVLGPKDKY